MSLLVFDEIFILMMVTTEMMLGGMNENRIGHGDQDNGDEDKSSNFHDGKDRLLAVALMRWGFD